MKSLLNATFVFCGALISISGVFAQTKPNIRTSPSLEQASNDNGNSQELNANKEKYEFHNARAPGQIDRVKVQLKVAGEGVSTKDGKEQREKMNVDCNLEYDEKTLETPSNVQNVSRSVRYYNRVDAAIVVGESQFKPVLRPERSLVAAEISPKSALLFSPQGALTREELELIDVQTNSLLLDQFLPDKPVTLGESWKPSEDLMAQLLGLDEVGNTDVECMLKEVTDRVARFEMIGNVSGAVEGVTSEIQVKARYRFDLKRNRIDWLGMLINEKRLSSPVNDGLDVVAQLQTIIIPADASERLSDAELKDLPLTSSPELIKLMHASKQDGWTVAHDRDWFVFRNKQDLVIFRRLEKGDLIAQGHISSLLQKNPDKLVSLDEFQEDVKRALGKEFKEFVEARQSLDESNRRVLRVVARGTSADLPMLWNYYHVADQQGRQIGFVFTYEEKYADRFNNADRELVNSLRFLDKKLK
jgi:hypothetical protein